MNKLNINKESKNDNNSIFQVKKKVPFINVNFAFKEAEADIKR